MSIEVDVFDVKKAEKELLACPDIIKDYVEKLKIVSNNWHSLNKLAVDKLKKQSHVLKNSVEALNVAVQFFGIADNYEEIEINGEMVSYYDILMKVENAIKKATE